MNNWFEVDRKGLAQLQKGKPKSFIINELTQNALDENITRCDIFIGYEEVIRDNDHFGEITITVGDDNPEGFKDITHAYTLFADTYKRRDPTKRGRFNLGEKQVIAICNYAKVMTTKGTVVFDINGRIELPECTQSGSIIKVIFNGTKRECNELIEHTKLLIVPPGIDYFVNNEKILPKTPFKTFSAILDTEVLKNDAMLLYARKTTINLIAKDTLDSYVFEMGIPVMKIDTPWHIDVQQKIPLAVDRETVRESFIQDIYAETLNNIYGTIIPEQSSEVWIRTAIKDKRVNKEATKHILELRYGNKLLVANSFDPNANDEALAHGYAVITGNQMSKEEWNTIRGFGLIQSTTDKFGKSGLAEVRDIEPEGERKTFADFVRKVAREYFGFDVTIKFVRSNIDAGAYYGGRTLTYNLSRLPTDFFVGVTKQNLDLTIHELGHEEGNHTEHDYHKCITDLAGWLIMKALNDPAFFEVRSS